MIGKKSLKPAFDVSVSFLNPLFGSRTLFFTDIWSSPRVIAAGKALKMLVLLLTTWGLIQFFRLKRPAATKGWLVSMLVVTFGYVVLYSQDGAVQGCYVGNFVTPVALLVAASSAYFASRTAAARFSLYLGATILSVTGILFSLKPTMRWQEAMYQAGIYLHAHPEATLVGSFNAGIIAFFAERGITNLDGLINDSILPYSKHDRLAAYMGKRNIRYVAEFPFVLYGSLYQKEGGYTDGRLLHCLTSANSLFPNDPDNNWQDSKIQLFGFDSPCLAATR